jgi:hypothetical protein
MKEIVLTSAKSDARLILLSSIICIPLAPELIASLFPNTSEAFSWHVTNVFLSASLGVFAWACFRLAEPRASGQGWRLVKLVGIPAAWVFLLLALAVCIHRAEGPYINLMQRITTMVEPITV